MKRFWKQAEAVPQDGGWGVALDGRPVRTPARAP
ncbi:MAG: ATP12 family protein, partial [Sphingopyxis granuli]